MLILFGIALIFSSIISVGIYFLALVIIRASLPKTFSPRYTALIVAVIFDFAIASLITYAIISSHALLGM